MNSKVDDYLGKTLRWKEELEQLRTIILDCGLTEELKWGSPCYSYRKHNVVIIGELKECCVLSFFKGALLKDTEGILVKPGENTQAARIIKFTGVKEIVKLKATLKAYIFEAIEIEKAGLKVDFKEKTQLVFPEELQNKFKKDTALKTAFNALTPGRQRAYILYFSQPKQSRTRDSRIEKCRQKILNGKGLNDW